MLVGQKVNHRENIHGQPLSWSETTRTWFNGHGSNLFDPQKWIAQSMPKKNQTIIFWPSGKNPNFGPCSIPKMYMSENAELPPSYGHKIHGERYFQRKFQDAKMEVLYHMNPYKAIFGGDIPWHIPYRGLIIYIYCRYCTSNLGSCSGQWTMVKSSYIRVVPEVVPKKLFVPKKTWKKNKPLACETMVFCGSLWLLSSNRPN